MSEFEDFDKWAFIRWGCRSRNALMAKLNEKVSGSYILCFGDLLAAWQAATCDANIKHQEEIKRLKAELEAERLTVDWYAPSHKWQFENPLTGESYKEGEGVYYVDEIGLMVCDGGSRARQRQKERKNERI